MFDYKQNHYFALLKPIEGNWSFVSYTHNGNTYRAIQGFNRDGVPKNFTIFFGDRERVYVCPKNKNIQVVVNNNTKEPVNMLLHDYMIKSGFCEGEFAIDPVFKLINEQRDAKEIIDIKAFRIKAENTALELAGTELRDMAALLGEFSDDKDLQKRAVLEFSGKEPKKFMELYEDAHRSTKALVKKAIKAGIMKETGNVVTWEKEVIGGSETQWVEYFAKDPIKLKALEKAVKEFK